MALLKFPKGFLWGAATSAHQVEGGNHNDWTEWEKKNASRLAQEARTKWALWQQEKFTEMFNSQNYISGKACDHYNLFEKDFNIAEKLGHNAHRFSIEWSRVEPNEGRFDEREIEHYRNVIIALRKRGMEPFVTLWHWTLPIWLSERKGILNQDFARYFARYAEFVVSKLKDNVQFWITLNEPTSVIANSYLMGNWPPQYSNIFSSLRAYSNLSRAHNTAYERIHELFPKVKVGFGSILAFIQPKNPKSFIDKFMARFYHYYSNEKMYRLTKDRNDFLAVQYYFHDVIGIGEKLPLQQSKLSDMGWEIYPEGIYQVLLEIKRYGLPVYVTENGIADSKDEKRANFIRGHISEILRAMREGVDVRGYFYWSLLDNFEWDKGFWPRFGLVEVDYTTQKRTARESAYIYSDIIKRNGIEA